MGFLTCNCTRTAISIGFIRVSALHVVLWGNGSTVLKLARGGPRAFEAGARARRLTSSAAAVRQHAEAADTFVNNNFFTETSSRSTPGAGEKSEAPMGVQGFWLFLLPVPQA